MFCPTAGSGRVFHFAEQNERAGGFAACCRSFAAARARSPKAESAP